MAEDNMPLTRDFRETVMARARQDAAYRRALLVEAIEVILSGDTTVGKALLRDYVNAVNTMPYKGYTARVSYDPEDRLLVGEVLGLPNDTIVFDAEDVETLEERFRDSIEAYLEDCDREGRKPVKHPE
jgi:hypothetical protein